MGDAFAVRRLDGAGWQHIWPGRHSSRSGQRPAGFLRARFDASWLNDENARRWRRARFHCDPAATASERDKRGKALRGALARGRGRRSDPRARCSAATGQPRLVAEPVFRLTADFLLTAHCQAADWSWLRTRTPHHERRRRICPDSCHPPRTCLRRSKGRHRGDYPVRRGPRSPASTTLLGARGGSPVLASPPGDDPRDHVRYKPRPGAAVRPGSHACRRARCKFMSSRSSEQREVPADGNI